MSDLADLIRRYRGYPELFVNELIFTPGQQLNPDQQKIVSSFEAAKAQYVKAGHGVGKTMTEAVLSLYFLTCYPFAMIPVTAPTVHQLHNVYAAEVKRWYDQSKLKELDLLRFKANQISINDDRVADIWAIKLQASNVPENLQGFHAKNIFYIVDEASGVQQKSLEVVEGALTTENTYFLACGNPTKTSGMFYDAFNKYGSKNNLLTISCENIDSPGMEAYAEKMATKYGKKSNVYRVRVQGEFPLGSQEMAFAPFIVENALQVHGLTSRQLVIGLDPGAGGDMSVMFMRCGRQIIGIKEFNYADTTKLLDEVVIICRSYAGMAVHFNMDSTGLGKPIYDSIEKMIRTKEICATVTAVNFKETPKDPVQYYDRPTELYLEARNKLLTGQYGILDNEAGELYAQLTERPMIPTDDGRLRIMPKKLFIKLFGISPNHGDAFALSMEEPDYKKTYQGA